MCGPLKICLVVGNLKPVYVLNRSLSSQTNCTDTCILCSEPLSGYPSIKQLSEYQVKKWHDLSVPFHLSEEEMGHSSTETFLKAKVKNEELKWKDILEALLSIEEYQLAVRVYREQGWLLSWLSGLARM